MKEEHQELLTDLARPGRGTTTVAIQQQKSAQRELAEGIKPFLPLMRHLRTIFPLLLWLRQDRCHFCRLQTA